ncbi:MAG: hypothetical protein K2J36_10400 [Ruminococcus sp.]|nr:hypothetical protein [Ruminococcus sp.]
MIENLSLFAPGEEIMEGTFRSRIFKDGDDDRLFVYFDSINIKDYAEKCIEHFNNMSDEMIDLICSGIIKCAELGGVNEEFELPELENVRDILKYFWCTNLEIGMPERDEIAYIIDGEGEWGEAINIVVRGNRVLYVGYDFGASPWEDDDYYKNLDSNCI